MPKEIERKFAVRNREIVCGRIGARIVQGYIADEPMTVRVRIIEAEAFMTLKGKAEGIARDEYEFPIPMRHAKELLARYCGRRIVEKTRYRLYHGQVVFEVDVFEGKLAGLVVCEVELDSVDQQISLPEWIGDELTYDRRYSNSALSLADGPPPSKSIALSA
jgi:adenylate cyclase